MIAGSEGAKQVHMQWGYRGPAQVMPQMGVPAVPFWIAEKRADCPLKVCFIGRLEICKGVDCLLHAVALLHRRGFEVECTIAGEGPERSRLARLAHDLGIWALVGLNGRLPKKGVQRLLKSSDVLVLPSRRTRIWQEQFGLVLAEAMAEGTITVGSRTGAIPEVIGRKDLLFPEDDANALAAVLQHLCSHPAFSLRCRLDLWERAQARFTAGAVADQKVRFLQNVLTNARQHKADPVRLSHGLTARAR